MKVARRNYKKKLVVMNQECKEIESNNQIGRTRSKKIPEIKGKPLPKMGMIKDKGGSGE